MFQKADSIRCVNRYLGALLVLGGLFLSSTLYAGSAGSLSIEKSITFDENTATGTTIDWGLGSKQSYIMGGSNVTISSFLPPASSSEITHLVLLVVQGGGVLTFSEDDIKWPGGVAPELSTSNIDILTFYYRGGLYYGSASFDYQ